MKTEESSNVQPSALAETANPSTFTMPTDGSLVDQNIASRDFLQRLHLIQLPTNDAGSSGALWPALRYKSWSELQEAVESDLRDKVPHGDLARIQGQITLAAAKIVPDNKFSVAYLLGREKINDSLISIQDERMVFNFHNCIAELVYKENYRDNAAFQSAHKTALKRIESELEIADKSNSSSLGQFTNPPTAYCDALPVTCEEKEGAAPLEQIEDVESLDKDNLCASEFMRTELEKVNAEKKSLESKIVDLEASVSSANRDVSSLKEKLELLRKENEVLVNDSAAAAQLRSELEKVKAEKASLESEITHVEASASMTKEADLGTEPQHGSKDEKKKVKRTPKQRSAKASNRASVFPSLVPAISPDPKRSIKQIVADEDFFLKVFPFNCPYQIMKDEDAWNLLQDKFEFEFVDGKHCLPGEENKPSETSNAKEGQHYFSTLDALRQHLCAHELPEPSLTLSEEEAIDIVRWVRCANVTGLCDGAEIDPSVDQGGSPIELFMDAWRLLCTSGCRFTGNYVLPIPTSSDSSETKKFATLESINTYFGKFGVPSHLTSDLNPVDRLNVDIYFASLAVKNTFLVNTRKRKRAGFYHEES